MKKHFSSRLHKLNLYFLLNVFCFFILEIAQARPVLHTSLMQRMTDVLSRMLNDPATRAALSGGGEDSLEGVIEQQGEVNQQTNENNIETNEEGNVNAVEGEAPIATESQNVEHNTTNNEVSESNRAIGNESNEEAAASEFISPTDQRSNIESEVPMEVESSHLEENETSSRLNQRCLLSQSSAVNEQSSNNITETSNSESNQNNGSMIENLQDRLSTLRDGFLER